MHVPVRMVRGLYMADMPIFGGKYLSQNTTYFIILMAIIPFIDVNYRLIALILTKYGSLPFILENYA